MTLIPLLLLGQGAVSGPQNDPAFRLAKSLVGGRWEGTVGKSTKVEFRFTLEADGALIVGNGLIDVGSKHPLAARSSMGWDPALRQVYYLDQHGGDTVYFGHVTADGNKLTFDFNGLSGDPGHYRSVITIGRGEYRSTMAVEKDGKWTDLGFHLLLKRKG